jgi:hypothetical protein
MAEPFSWFEATDARHATIGAGPDPDRLVLTLCGQWATSAVWQGAPEPTCYACDAVWRRRRGMEPHVCFGWVTVP